MIGQGFYTLSEVARFTGLPVATVRSWFKDRPDGKGHGPVFQSDFAVVGRDYGVSFLNLIDAYVAAFFRAQHVPSRVIRKAHGNLQQRLGTPHPFAHTDLRTSQGRIIESMSPADEAEAAMVDVVNGQFWFDKMEGLHAEVDYDPVSKLARAWKVRPEYGVVIRPGVNFGQPSLEGTNIPTLIVASQYKANRGDETLVARLFETSAANVLNAYRFERGIGRLAA